MELGVSFVTIAAMVGVIVRNRDEGVPRDERSVVKEFGRFLLDSERWEGVLDESDINIVSVEEPVGVLRCRGYVSLTVHVRARAYRRQWRKYLASINKRR